MKRNEKRKSSKSRLLLLILLLILTLGIGATGTFAWFTSNKVVDVTDIEVQVRAVNGLEISADAESWGVRLTKETLVNGYDGDTNQIPDILGAVSTNGAINNSHLMNMYVGSVETSCTDGTTTCDNPTYRLTTKTSAEEKCFDTVGGATNETNIPKCTDKYFMAFDIFLKVDQDSELLLTANSIVDNVTLPDKGIQNSTRVAFVVQGSVPYNDYRDGVTNDGVTTTGPNLARALNGATDDTVYIWEPNYDAHTASAVAAALKYYGINDISAGTGNERKNYEGVKANILAGNDLNSDGVEDIVTLTTTNGEQWPEYFETVVPAITTTAGNANSTSTTITLPAGVTKVRVYFWVEGQDVDAENDATGSDMKLNLEFTIN